MGGKKRRVKSLWVLQPPFLSKFVFRVYLLSRFGSNCLRYVYSGRLKRACREPCNPRASDRRKRKEENVVPPEEEILDPPYISLITHLEAVHCSSYKIPHLPDPDRTYEDHMIGHGHFPRLQVETWIKIDRSPGLIEQPVFAGEDMIKKWKWVLWHNSPIYQNLEPCHAWGVRSSLFSGH